MKLIEERKILPDIYGGRMPSPATLSRLLKQDNALPPHVTIGRRRFYDPAAVVAWATEKMKNSGK